MSAPQDQSEVVGFLESPAAFGGAGPVRRIDTHISVVTMAGDRVLKLKRALVTDFLDYGTVAKRREACMAELAVNRRTAPSIYLDALPVTRDESGALRLGGDGAPLDWVVVMRRFDDSDLFVRLAERGALTDALVDGAADAAARLHDEAERTPAYGGHADMAWVADGNLDALADAAGGLFERAEVARLERLTRDALARHRGLMEKRRREGFSRRCHGDLHLGNICLVDGAPTLFDAIEFNDRVACCDVLYDIAFLVMDLWQRGHHDQAARVLNRYVWRTGDDGGLALVPLFLSCRAAVRAKTSAWAAARQPDAAEAERLGDEARAYLKLALACLDRPRPALVAVGGLSGTGKTTLALGLAAGLPGVPGALVVRSDVLRKQLAGVALEQHLPADAYSAEASQRVYRRLAELAAGLLGTGLSVVCDAVYAKAEERDAIAHVAADAGVRFDGLWLEAPIDTLQARVTARQGDASDADATVVRRQAGHDVGALAWARLDAGAAPEEVTRRARDLLDRRHAHRASQPDRA